jgi:hypothetical protein
MNSRNVQLLLILLLSLFLASCSTVKPPVAPVKAFGTFNRFIPIPEPTPEQRARFTAETIGVRDSIVKNDTLILRGHTTRNKEFLTDVIDPALAPYLDSLRKKHPADMINDLALFGYELYQTFFGKDFYRWAGDIMDIDDPQDRGHRALYRYGLDCSGYVGFPYETAVYFGLIDSTSPAAVYSSKGFAQYCRLHNAIDRGGRSGTSNNFRLDTYDFVTLGREVFALSKGGSPTPEQMALAQPGDIVGRPGHIGILIRIENDMYYLESGGAVVPRSGYAPAHAVEALTIFAKNGPLTIRRSLPDLPK